MVRNRYWMGVLALSTLGGASLHAATVTPGTNAAELNVSAIPAAGSTPSTGTEILGYDFPDVGGNGYFLSQGAPYQVNSGNVTDGAGNGTFAIVTYPYQGNGANYYSGNAYAPLSIGGASPAYTGFEYLGSSASPQQLLSFTVGSSAPSSFQLGILENNTNVATDDTPITVTGTDGTSVTVNAPPPGTAGAADFYFVDITNAAAGDVVTLSGTNAAGNAGLGGIVFEALPSSNPIPEPTSLALIGLPLAGLLRRARRA